MKQPLIITQPDVMPFPFGQPVKPKTVDSFTDKEPQPICFVIGVDLGQARDFSAVCINQVSFAERVHVSVYPDSAARDPVIRREQIRHHEIRHVERIPLGTSYPDVIARVAEIVARVPAMPRPAGLVVDATGCGRPVLDLMRKSGLKPLGVTITAGSAMTIDNIRNDAKVAKKILASGVAVALDTERLRVTAAGDHVTTLRDELRAFRVKVSANQNESFESWREADHDDLVLAAALAVWAGERLRPLVKVNPQWSMHDR